MSLKVADNDLSMIQPSMFFENLLLSLKLHSVENLINDLQKINFEQIGINFFEFIFYQRFLDDICRKRKIGDNIFFY